MGDIIKSPASVIIHACGLAGAMWLYVSSLSVSQACMALLWSSPAVAKPC